MKHSNRIISIIICAVLSAGVLSACAGGSDTNSGGTLTDTESVLKDVSEESAELPDISNAAVITLSDESAAVSGSGAEVENKTVTITDGGAYVVTGKTSDGRIIVNAPDKEVTVVLKNADISCSYGSPIYIYKSLLTTVYLTEGTANTLTDGSNYTFSDSFSSSADEEPNACLYSKSDLVIAGSGQLTVNANYNNGITSKDTLKIELSSVTVTAVNHGINGKDCCEIKNAAIKITSGKDALRSTNDSDSTLGYIVISDSSLDITSGEDGIQALQASLLLLHRANPAVRAADLLPPEDGPKTPTLLPKILIPLPKIPTLLLRIPTLPPKIPTLLPKIPILRTMLSSAIWTKTVLSTLQT